jgi:hypothetical protein
VTSDDAEQAGEPPTLGEDFDRSLAWAEALLAGVERGYERLALVRVSLGVAVTGVAFLGIAIIVVTSISWLAAVGVMIMALLVIATGLVLAQVWLIAPRRRLLRRDEDAMVEMVEILKQFEPSLSEHESWGHVRRYLARSRFARFPIAPGVSWHR